MFTINTCPVLNLTDFIFPHDYTKDKNEMVSGHSLGLISPLIIVKCEEKTERSINSLIQFVKTLNICEKRMIQVKNKDGLVLSLLQ